MASKRRRKRKRSPWLAAFLAVVLLALAGLSWYLFHSRDQLGLAQPAATAEIDAHLRLLAERLGATPRDIRADDPITKRDGIFVRTWRITLPTPEAVTAMAAVIETEAPAWHVDLQELEAPQPGARRLRLDGAIEAFDLTLVLARRITAVPVSTPTATPRPRPTARPTVPPWVRGKLAILLDDAGQSLDLVPLAAALPAAVGVSVLPFLPSSSAAAAQLHGSGHEVWLHLPMEPAEYPASNPGPGAVLLSMAEPEIRRTVRAALNNVPHVVGVNNHMGSRATTDLRTMTWVLQEISARGVAFLDSRTARATIAEEAARSQGVPTGRRHIFLDNSRSAEAIRRQLDEAVYRARKEGQIIAIGHMTGVTLRVLQAELPGLAERGVDLVSPTTLLE